MTRLGADGRLGSGGRTTGFDDERDVVGDGVGVGEVVGARGTVGVGVGSTVGVGVGGGVRDGSGRARGGGGGWGGGRGGCQGWLGRSSVVWHPAPARRLGPPRGRLAVLRPGQEYPVPPHDGGVSSSEVPGKRRPVWVAFVEK